MAMISRPHNVWGAGRPGMWDAVRDYLTGDSAYLGHPQMTVVHTHLRMVLDQYPEMEAIIDRTAVIGVAEGRSKACLTTCTPRCLLILCLRFLLPFKIWPCYENGRVWQDIEDLGCGIRLNTVSPQRFCA